MQRRPLLRHDAAAVARTPPDVGATDDGTVAVAGDGDRCRRLAAADGEDLPAAADGGVGRLAAAVPGGPCQAPGDHGQVPGAPGDDSCFLVNFYSNFAL